MEDYIIPKPFDPRLISTVPLSVAKAAIESGVAKIKIDNWGKYEKELESRLGNNNRITRLLIAKAKQNPKKIVFVEADRLDVLKAAQTVYDEGIGIPILIGRIKRIKKLIKELELGFSKELKIIDLSIDKSKKQIRNMQKYFLITERIKA